MYGIICLVALQTRLDHLLNDYLKQLQNFLLKWPKFKDLLVGYKNISVYFLLKMTFT